MDDYAVLIEVIDNPEMDDQYAHVSVRGVIGEDGRSRKLLTATRVSGGGVYLTGDEHEAVTYMEAPHWRALAVKVARHVGVTGPAAIRWEHEGPGRARGRDVDFTV